MQSESVTRIQADPSQGLSSAQVAQRRAQGLVNTQPNSRTKTIPQIIRDNLFTLFNAFNFGLGLCIFLVGEYTNLTYLGVIIANNLIGIVQEIRSKRIVDKLSVLSAPRAVVVRDSAEAELPVEDLVLDDIAVLSLGNQVCADSIVVEGEVEVNEALLTGESDPIRKQAGDMLLSGSFIVSGSCRARVEHIGADNYATNITVQAKQYKKVESELLSSLNKIVKFTGYFIIPIGLAQFARSYIALQQPLSVSVTSSSAALIGMMPKGLVLLTSVALAVGVIKLARRKTLVQELFCIETLSRVDILCLDKTGTLTKGEMQVCDVLELDCSMPVSLAEAMGAFTCCMEDNNATFRALCEHFAPCSTYVLRDRVAFSSARKWSAAAFDFGTVVVGAPDVIMANTAYTLPARALQYEQEGCRVLLAAYSPASAEGALPQQLQPMAAIILCDPIRPEAKETLDFFRSQDVQIKLISGDNPVTVASIARQAGLPDCSYVDASTLQTEEDIINACERYTIFGRVSPQQKRSLVNAFKANGHTVAMTGDGVNDVLALHDADCSIAMASGSDAARQISQLVLLDSNFSSLPYVVMEGRRVVNNISASASLFLVKTIFSFVLALVTLVLPMTYPFIPSQLSLISVFTVGTPAFFLALEPNGRRIQGAFLPNVLRKALPTGLCFVITALVTSYLGVHGVLSEFDATTLRIYLCAFLGVIMLVRSCIPFTLLRVAMVTVMTVAMVAAMLLFPSFFSIGLPTAAMVPYLVVGALLGLGLMWLFSLLVDHLPFVKKALARIR